MPYLALSFNAPGDDAERWADALLESGAISVDAADANAGTNEEAARFGEPGADTAAWPMTRLTALFDAAADIAATLGRVEEAMGRPSPPHAIEAVPETDWVRKTQLQFAPIQVSERLWIVPTWCEPAATNAINLRIDPGLAFGTGSHATTRLCLRWLDAHLAPGASLLDYGCGSGILAIAAMKFGAPDTLPDGAFDVVVANILANPLELLAPLLAGRVRPYGQLVLSGILDAQAAAVAAAYARWFTLDVWGREEGWVALAGSRRDDG
jgi:ribosomal protein L11 methyltransferase